MTDIERRAIDVIRGLVTGYKTPGSADYAGQWPEGWVDGYQNGGKPSLDLVPAAAKNTTAAQIQFFNSSTWSTWPSDRDFKVMSFRIPAVPVTARSTWWELAGPLRSGWMRVYLPKR